MLAGGSAEFGPPEYLPCSPFEFPEGQRPLGGGRGSGRVELKHVGIRWRLRLCLRATGLLPLWQELGREEWIEDAVWWWWLSSVAVAAGLLKAGSPQFVGSEEELVSGEESGFGVAE